MSIKKKGTSPIGSSGYWLDEVRATSDLRLVFNFSFLCSDDKYNLKNSDIDHRRLLARLEELSQRTWVALTILPKSSGIERVSKSNLSGRLKDMPDPKGFGDKRLKYATDKVAIIRLNGKARLIGKLIDQTFYLFWIDLNHELYKG